MAEAHVEKTGKCPFLHNQQKQEKVVSNKLNLKVLQPTKYLQHYDYRKEFLTLDLKAVKHDLAEVLTTSQDWWPADYGNYGPFMVRLAWHVSGTYRTMDGRGGANTGNMRFAPLNSWPDNGNLDKARRLLYPIKQKYGKKLSWGDLMILSGNVAMETMGFETYGFAGGRVDVWAPEEDVYWGPEHVVMASERYTDHGDRESLFEPLAAAHMGLIYVNPEGPNGNPDPAKSAQDIRVTFGRMAMNDEETVALIAGGHTFGKCHGATNPDGNVGPAPNDSDIEFQGFGWTNSSKAGVITSGLEGAWTADPTRWDHGFFTNLFKYEWELIKGPGGAHQWQPKDYGYPRVPDAFDSEKKHLPMMLTSDLALKFDPEYKKISERFLKHPEEFKLAFAKAWYKLTHRDMGPITRCLGSDVAPEQTWQDPCGSPCEHLVATDAEIAEAKRMILKAGHSVADLVTCAWSAASSFRVSDFRGGVNGGRIFLEPQNSWACNKTYDLKGIHDTFKKIRAKFPHISLADLVALGGCTAVEFAAADGACFVSCDFTPGRTDSTQEQTDVDSFAWLEPRTDGFRNFGDSNVFALVDRAQQLTLTAPEMSVLVAGLRALGVSNGKQGVFTKTPGTLTNDFFVSLCSMSTSWKKTADGTFVGTDRKSGEEVATATSNDLIFGSNPELRAIAEYYAQNDSATEFVQDFAKAFSKVMNLDRDLTYYEKKYVPQKKQQLRLQRMSSQI